MKGTVLQLSGKVIPYQLQSSEEETNTLALVPNVRPWNEDQVTIAAHNIPWVLTHKSVASDDLKYKATREILNHSQNSDLWVVATFESTIKDQKTCNQGAARAS